MREYWRLIGISSENATDDQIRQAHFRTFRFYQGRKNSSKIAEQRAEAERVIDYLRRAQHNPDLPLPDNLRHLLPPLPQTTTVSEAPPTHAAPVEPPQPAKPQPPQPQSKPPDVDVDLFNNPNISAMARDIFGSHIATPQEKPKEEVVEKVPEAESSASIDDFVEDNI